MTMFVGMNTSLFANLIRRREKTLEISSDEGADLPKPCALTVLSASGGECVKQSWDFRFHQPMCI